MAGRRTSAEPADPELNPVAGLALEGNEPFDARGGIEQRTQHREDGLQVQTVFARRTTSNADVGDAALHVDADDGVTPLEGLPQIWQPRYNHVRRAQGHRFAERVTHRTQ